MKAPGRHVSMQRRRASRSGRSEFQRPRRLARAADGERWARTMRRALIALFFAGLLTGCGNPQRSAGPGLWWRSYRSLEYSYHLNSEIERKEAIRLTNEQASDPSEDRRSRALAIFYIFRIHVRPGFQSADFRNVMEHAKWLDEVDIQPVRALGGFIFAGRPPGSSVFSMAVLPNETGWSEWCIEFTLSGLESRGTLPWEECRKRALDFLKGNLPDSRVRLLEFALLYPMEKSDKTEIFTRCGVGLHVYDN